MAVKKIAVVVAVCVVLLGANRAAAEPDPKREPIHLTVPTTASDGAGHSLALPPGVFLSNEKWDELDRKVTVLQEDRTRLTAENEYLRGSTDAPGWWWVAAGVLAGAAAGIYAGTRL